MTVSIAQFFEVRRPRCQGFGFRAPAARASDTYTRSTKYAEKNQTAYFEYVN